MPQNLFGTRGRERPRGSASGSFMEERQRQREEADREQADLQQQIDYNARLRERDAASAQKERERAQKEKTDADEKQRKDFQRMMEEKRREAQRVGNYHAKEVYDAQGRPTKTDLDGNVIPKETDEQYEERVRKEARDKLQAERDKAQREQYAIQDAEADIAPKPLGVEERRRIEKERDEAKSTVRGELGVRYGEMARGSKDSGFMWFDSAEDKRNREAYQKRANEIYSGEAEPTEDEWGMVPPEVKSKIDEANGILAKDDEAKKFHGEHAEAKRLRALQKLSPKRYEAEMAKKRAMMTPEEREKALLSEKEAFAAEQEALEAKIGEFSGEIGQWDGRIAELEERNAALLGKGLVPRDAVSVPGADGSTKHYDAAIYGEIQELQRGREAKRGEWIERDERLRAEAEAVKQRADSLRKREAEILEVKRAKEEKELATMEQDQTLAPYVAEMRADKDLADWSMERVSERLGNDPQAMETARAAINARLAEREDERGKALNEEIELQGKRAEAGMAMMDALDDAEQRASELEGAAAAAIMAGGGSNAKAYDHAEAIRAEGEAKAMEIAKANGMDETEAKAAFADARMATDWKGSDDKVRVLSTGRVLLNPDPEFLLDDDEVRDAIAGSSANPFRKKLALAELKSMQNAVASIAIEGLRKVTAFTDWADKHGKKYAGELGITTDVDLLRGFLNDASGYRQWNAKSQLIFKESFNQIGKDLAALGGMIHLGAANLVGAEGYKDQVLGRVGEISELNEDDAATYEGAHAALGTSKAQRLIQGGAVSLIPSLTGAGLAVSGTRTLLNGLARNVVKGIAAKATRGGLTKGALAVAEKNLAGIAKKAGARMGLDGAAVSAMAQETGGIFPRHYQMNLDRGMSPSDAANAAAGSAIVSGIGVAVATRAFGYRGTESIFGKTGSELLIKGGRDKLLQVMKDKGFRKLFAQVVKERVLDGLTEAPEEGLAALWSGIVEKWTANPDKTWGEIWSEAFEGAWVGAVLGTGVPAVKSLSGIADYRKGRELRGKDLVLAADVAVAREHVTNAPLPEGADPLSHEAGKEQVMASLRLMEKGVDALNQTELSALGLERKNGKVVEKALPKGEDGAAPVRTVMMEDGVPIVTDEGLAAIESISPEARRLFKLDEAEQRDQVRLNKILQETRAAEAKQATEAKQKEETTPATAATAETDPRFEPLVVRLVETHGMDQATAEAEAGKALPRYGPNEDYTLIATDIAGDQLDTAATEKPATEPASDKPATWQPDRSAKLPRELAGAKPNYGKAKLGFDSDIDRALFITSQAKKSPRDADYRAWLREQGFTDGQIDSEGKKLRARVKGLAIGSMNTSGSVVFIPPSPEPTKAKQDEATKKPPQQTTEANPAADAPVHTQEATAGVSNTDTVPAPGQVEGTHEGQGQEAEIDPSEEADPDDIAETIAELEQSEPNPPLSEQEQAEEAENFQRQGKPDSYDNLDPVPTTVPKVIEGEGARVLREVIESENGERLANAGIEVDYVPDPGEGTSGVSVDADTGRIKVNLERFGKAFSGFGNKRKIARRVFDEELHHATTIKALLVKHKGDMTKVRAEVASAYKNFEKTQKKHADRLGNLYGGKRWGAMDDFRKGMEVIRMFHQMANGGFTTENVWRTGKENVEGRKAFDALLKERPPVTNAFRKILQAFIDFVSGNKDLSAVDDMVRLSKAADKFLKQSTPKESMARKMGKNMDRADTPVMNFLRENPVKAKNHHDNAKTLFRINIKRAKGDELSEKETQWLSDYDGQPSSKSFGKYGKGLFVRTGGSNPDQVAQQLADEGMIENGTAEALYQALERERTGKAMDAVNPMEKTDSRGDHPGERFARDTSEERKGSVRQVALGLDAGDIIKVNGERVEILENDNDFVTFQGGKKYGYGRVPVMLDLWIDKDSPSIQNNGGMSALFASAPDAQFKSLTADLPSKPSQEQLGAWRKANPEKYAELKAMREKVLRAAGWGVGPVWHGTPDGRFLDNDPVFRSQFDRFGAGSKDNVQWFSEDRTTASTYADDRRAFDYQNSEPRTIPVFLKLVNPLEVDGENSTWRDAQKRGKTSDVIESAIKSKNDGVIIRRVKDLYNSMPGGKSQVTTTYSTFRADQIKTAEPLNIGPDGKLIPPSQWGDPESDSILYASAPEIETIINRLHQARREAETSRDFIRTFSQSHLTDLSNPGMHNVGRAIPPFKDEPYTDIEEILENNKNYLETIRHEEPAVYREITKPGDTVTVYRAVPSSLAMEGIRIGDYVALERRYAEMHAESVLGAQQGIDGEVIKLNVPKRDVVWGEVAFSEWAYSPRELRDQIKSLEEFYENPTSASSEGGTRQINASAPDFADDFMQVRDDGDIDSDQSRLEKQREKQRQRDEIEQRAARKLEGNADFSPDLFGNVEGIEDDQGSLFAATPEQSRRYLELAKDPEKNRDELQKMVDDAANSNGYFDSHRRRDGKDPRKTGYVVLFADDADKNSHYGPSDYRVNINIARSVEDWMVEWYADSEFMQQWAEINEVTDREKIIEQARREMEPSDIVDSAGFWDSAEAVSQFWEENESKLVADGIAAVKTPDGVVVFDSYSFPSAIKSADPVTYDAQGNVIPLEQRFNPQEDSILYASTPEQSALHVYENIIENIEGGDSIRHGDAATISNQGPTVVSANAEDIPANARSAGLPSGRRGIRETESQLKSTKAGKEITRRLAEEGIRNGRIALWATAKVASSLYYGRRSEIRPPLYRKEYERNPQAYNVAALVADDVRNMITNIADKSRAKRNTGTADSMLIRLPEIREWFRADDGALMVDDDLLPDNYTGPLHASAPEAARPLPGDMPWDRAAKSAVGAIAKAAKHTPGYNALAVGLAEFYGDSKLTKPIRGTINYLRGQFVPDGLMPREARALLHEMRIKQAVGAEKALDVWRAATGKTVKFSDLAFPAAWKGDTDMQRRMFWAMNGKVSMASLPKELQDLAGKLRAMLDEEAREAVRQGRMHPDTYKSMREEGYMPHYYFEHETMAGKMAGIFRRYKLNQGDIKAQRMTAYRIESLNEKDRNGLPAMLNWTDAKTGRKAYRFKGKEHMDAWFENFILEETAKVVSGKKGFGKIGASQLQRLEELPAEQRGYARRVMEETRRKWVKQKPLDAEEQEAVGLITDPVYAITRYVAQMSHDNATAHVFNQVANNPEWATVQDLAGMKQIPDRPGFGKLAGMYVIPEIYDQVTELANIPHTALRVYDKFLTLFKTGKTVWNPGTHGRNVLGNIMFSMLAGTTVWSNPQYYARAHKTIVKGGADLQEMYDEGVLGADFIQGELKENMLSLLPNTALIGDGESVSRFSEAWLKADKGRKKIADKVNALYTYEDAIYKAAAYLKARNKGFTPKQAADHVRMWFPFYDQVGSSALVKGLKRGPMPFFSFFRESTRILGNGVRHRPISLMAMMALPEMVSWISAAALGLTDDDEEQIRKDMRGKGKFMFRDTPIFAMLMPFTDSQGRPVQWDLSNIIPFADLLGKKLDYGKKKPFWAELADKMMASPALGVMAAAMGKDTFRDRDLYHEDESTTAKAVKTAKEIYRKLAPPLLPGGTSWDTIAASAERSTNKTLERRSMPMATARALSGLDFRNANPDWYRQQEEVRRDMGKKDGSYTMGASAPATAERKKLWGLLVQAIDGKDDMDEIVQTLNNLTEYGWDIRENKLSTILAPRNPTPRDEAEAATNDRLMRRKGPLSFAQHMRIKREYKQIVDKAGPIIDRATRLMEPPKPRLLTTTN